MRLDENTPEYMYFAIVNGKIETKYCSTEEGCWEVLRKKFGRELEKMDVQIEKEEA